MFTAADKIHDSGTTGAGYDIVLHVEGINQIKECIGEVAQLNSMNNVNDQGQIVRERRSGEERFEHGWERRSRVE
jgi:hypothetical protein